MLYNGLPLYDVTPDDDFEMTNISIVDDPAVEVDFLKFKKEKRAVLLQAADEHIITGVAIRADFPIYRNDENGGYYVRFTREAIKSIVKQYSRDGFFNQVSLQHDGKRVDGVHLVEMFIKDKSRGINPSGFEDIEDGSLFVSYHVENEELWDSIKNNGDLNGFSIEIYTTMTETDDEPALEELIEQLLSDQKKKFAVVDDIDGLLKSGKVADINTVNRTINEGQVYQIGSIGGKPVAVIYGKNGYGRFQWYVEPINNIKGVEPLDVEPQSWNTAREVPSWVNVEKLLDSERMNTIATAVVSNNEYERAIKEHKVCMITYRDATQEPCTYSRQCGVFEYGYNANGHAALRAYQYYGSTHTESEGWKMFLLSRILSFTVLDYMKPIETAPAGFNMTGPDRDNFNCILRADYIS